MIEPSAVAEVIAQYEKHGWTLRRALLSAEGQSASEYLAERTEVVDSDFDALWFSRKSKADSEAWELRRLTGSPFALVAVVSTSAERAEVAETLSQLVDEMRAKTFA